MIEVLVDGRCLYDASSLRGFGRYLRAVLSRLGRRSDMRVRVLVTPGTTTPEGVDAIHVRRRAPSRLADLEHRLRLPLDLRGHHADVYWSPGLHPPWRYRGPWVQTLYDLIPVVDAHPGHRVERRRWRARARRLRGASAFVAISEHTAGSAVATLGLERDRVHVVSLGVDERFRPPVIRPAPEPPYILYVGEYGPSKGYAEAFDVVGRLEAAGQPHRLVVVGRLEDWNRSHVDALLADADRPERVDLVGWVPDDELVELYRGATALVVTSRAEGFGLPAAEAMASGTPVVAFRHTALTETVAGGGVLVDDGDVTAMAKAVERLIGDPEDWADMSRRGVERAAAFDWDDTAHRHAEIFLAVAGR